jgi:hypothetical protein
MTGVLRDLVRDALTGWPDIELIEAGESAAGIRGATTVVCAARSPDEVNHLLYANPRVRVLTVENDGRRGSVHELVPRSLALGEPSPARLLAAIRGTPAAPHAAGHRRRRGTGV